jgi:hypothetical protein
METIDHTIIDKGYSVFKMTDTGRYYAMPKREVERIHRISNGKSYNNLARNVTVSVCELVVKPDKTIVFLNEDEITITANSLMPVPIKLK